MKSKSQQVFEDLYDGLIPKRVPIAANLSVEFAIQRAGLPLAETQWTLKGMDQALDDLCAVSPSDVVPGGHPRYPAHFHILNARTFMMGSNGFMQHPEVHGLEAEDYDDFIRNPHDCLMEKVLPRLYPALNTDPVGRSMVFAKAMLANMDYQNKYGAITAALIKKYGYYAPPPGSMGGVTAPFDYLADFLRSFSGICLDVRRFPEKVARACEALIPYQVKKGLPSFPHRHGYTFIALHMATYLRTRDFEKLFWPSLLTLVRGLAEKGQYCYLFCEHDWMRYLDHLSELPENTRLYFEYGDPQAIKDKLGKKLVLGGLYPITYLKTATKEQCLDKARELLDIMAPGGNYIFNFDKSPLSPGDINFDNYVAVLEYVRDHTRYDNAGERVRNVEAPGKLLDREIPVFESRYYDTWDAYKARNPVNKDLEPVMEPILMGYEELLQSLLNRWC